MTSEDDDTASWSPLLARSTSIFNSESSCVDSDSDGFLTSSDLPNQPNHDFFVSIGTSLASESFSFLLSAFWQLTVSSVSRSEGRFVLNRMRLKKGNGYQTIILMPCLINHGFYLNKIGAAVDQGRYFPLSLRSISESARKFGFLRTFSTNES